MQIDGVREVVGELDDLGALVDGGARDVLVTGGDAPVLDLALLLQRLADLDRLAAVERVGRGVMQEEEGDRLDAEALAASARPRRAGMRDRTSCAWGRSCDRRRPS